MNACAILSDPAVMIRSLVRIANLHANQCSEWAARMEDLGESEDAKRYRTDEAESRALLSSLLQEDRSHLLRPFSVSLKEDKGDKFTIVFECSAEDRDHAEEQAENAYPSCEIVLVTDLS